MRGILKRFSENDSFQGMNSLAIIIFGFAAVIGLISIARSLLEPKGVDPVLQASDGVIYAIVYLVFGIFMFKIPEKFGWINVILASLGYLFGIIIAVLLFDPFITSN